MSKIIGITVGTPTSPACMDRELKPVKTVNGVSPDENGNVDVVGGNVDLSNYYTKDEINGQIADNNATNKKYVDDAIAEAIGEALEDNY